MKKFLLGFICIVLLFNLNYYIYADDIEEETDYIWLNEEISKASANIADEPILNSRYACVFDRSSKQILYGKDENRRVPMASTTKIMTAIVLMENLEKSNLDLKTEIEVCKAAEIIQGSRLGLKEGDKISINDLLYGLLLCSRK